jgi:hypothetical protein
MMDLGFSAAEVDQAVAPIEAAVAEIIGLVIP